MLHLVGETSREWVTHAVAHFSRVLVDHAHCEHKAAVTALSFCGKYPDDPKLVVALGSLASDEAGHYARVAALCVARGLDLGHPERDPYVDGLLAQVRKDNVLDGRVDRLLCAALIEGRSCERLKLLADELPKHRSEFVDDMIDDNVCALYADLWREEATHHLLFIDLAERSYERSGVKEAKQKTTARLAQLAAAEGELVKTLPVRAAIH